MRWRFTDFELDERKGIRTRDGLEVRIQPKALSLLLFLLRNRDRVVSQEELYAEVPGWGPDPLAPRLT